MRAFKKTAMHDAGIRVSLDSVSALRVPLWLGMEHVHTRDLGTLSDEALLRYSLESPSAFEFLVIRYQKTFFERASHITRNRDEAEDVVQDAFVRIYRFAPRFDEKAGTFRSWAMTILMNVARTKYRKKTLEHARVAPLSPEHYESLAAPSSEDARNAKDILERAFPFLPADARTILKLAFIDDLPYREIAEREHTSVGAVKTRVHRAKKILRSIIGTVDI